jgi:hypothetical protein
MADSEKLVLLPASINYYNLQLQELLQQERIAEAIQLLRFLVACSVQPQEEVRLVEWQQLLAALEEEFPQAAEEELLDEREMRLRAAQQKAGQDIMYVDQMAAVFLNGGEQQAFALEQLSLLNYERLVPMLEGWLKEAEHDPMIQWMALQVLRKHGYDKPLQFVKDGMAVTMLAEQVPTREDEYPAAWRSVGFLAIEVASQMHVNLVDWIGETWMRMFIYQFGTKQFTPWMEQLEANPRLWACAIHFQLAQMVEDEPDFEAFVEAYGLQEVTEEAMQQTMAVMKTLK